jgi:vancomycin resistance protein VanJ
MKNLFKRYTVAAIWVYFTVLFGWLALYLGTGDRFGYISLVNSLAVYLFFPLPLVFLIALFVRRAEIWTGVILGSAVFLWFWGGLFIPQPRHAQAGGETLSVMTFNVLGKQDHTSQPIAAIRAENADVVFLQELNPNLAQAVQTELAGEFPYQVLAPVPGVAGMGVISKYPLHLSPETLPAPDWVGPPQVLSIEWNGITVNLVNFHMAPVGFADSPTVSRVDRTREYQAKVVADFARQAGLIIAAGDANATSLSTSYHILTGQLHDSWGEAGFGFGNTFPGSDIPGSSHPHLAGWPVPKWLIRIDYVFHSSEWRTISARNAQFDGVSDHRGVVVVLAWDSQD